MPRAPSSCVRFEGHENTRESIELKEKMEKEKENEKKKEKEAERKLRQARHLRHRAGDQRPSEGRGPGVPHCRGHAWTTLRVAGEPSELGHQALGL